LIIAFKFDRLLENPTFKLSLSGGVCEQLQMFLLQDKLGRSYSHAPDVDREQGRKKRSGYPIRLYGGFQQVQRTCCAQPGESASNSHKIMSNPKLLSPSIMRQVLSKGMLVQPNEQFWAFDIKRKS